MNAPGVMLMLILILILILISIIVIVIVTLILIILISLLLLVMEMMKVGLEGLIKYRTKTYAGKITPKQGSVPIIILRV